MSSTVSLLVKGRSPRLSPHQDVTVGPVFVQKHGMGICTASLEVATLLSSVLMAEEGISGGFKLRGSWHLSAFLKRGGGKRHVSLSVGVEGLWKSLQLPFVRVRRPGLIRLVHAEVIVFLGGTLSLGRTDLARINTDIGKRSGVGKLILS